MRIILRCANIFIWIYLHQILFSKNSRISLSREVQNNTYPNVHQWFTWKVRMVKWNWTNQENATFKDTTALQWYLILQIMLRIIITNGLIINVYLFYGKSINVKLKVWPKLWHSKYLKQNGYGKRNINIVHLSQGKKNSLHTLRHVIYPSINWKLHLYPEGSYHLDFKIL